MTRRYFQPFSAFASHTTAGEHEADRLYDAVGAVALTFAELEDEVSLACERMLRVEQDVADAVTCEMSFKNKLQLLGSLMRLRAQREPSLWPAKGNRSVAAFEELLANCFEAEQLRNTLLHSSYVYPVRPDGAIKRRKITAKGKGLRVNEVVETPKSLLRAAAFIVATAEDVNEFFFNDARP